MLYEIVSLLQSFSIATTTVLFPSCKGILEQLIIPLFASNVNGTEAPLSVVVILELAGIFTVLTLII